MGLPGINLIIPEDLLDSPDILIHFDATYQDNTDGLQATSVIIEVDTVNTFDSPDIQASTFSDVASGDTLRAVLCMTDGTWYWRVTATNADGTTVSSTRSFTVDHILKRILYQYENISIGGPEWSSKRILYQYENVAKYGPEWSGSRAIYQYENITDDPPSPFIERLSTTRSASCGVVIIFGNGFGAKADIDTSNPDRASRGYGGYVLVGDILCNILSWSWTEIVFQVPDEAVSGAVKVRLTEPDPPGARDSNLIGLEVYETEKADDIGIELFVCDSNNPNTILCQLGGAVKKSFQALLNNPGSGKFHISRYDDAGGNRDYISDQNFILCRLDGVDVFKWIIESKKPSYVDESEQQMIEVTGRGVLSLLERAVIYPDGMPNPSTLERTFTDMHGAAILRLLLLEAQARGCLTGVVIDWSAEADCLGNPFDDSTTISFHAGMPISQVATKFSEGMGLFDLEMTSNLKLKLYKSRGSDKYEEVRYRPGQAIVRHQNQSDSSKLTNTLLVEGESGTLIETQHPTSQTDWGRREGYLQARNIPGDWAKLQDYGQMFLKSAAQVSWGIQGTVAKVEDSKGNILKPFETFQIGDKIGWYIPPEGTDNIGFDGRVRVKGITCEENDSGAVLYVLELNNLMLEHEIRLNQLVERMSMFTQNSELAAPSSEIPATVNHSHEHAVLGGLDGDDHTQYLNTERHAADLHEALVRVSGIKSSGGNTLSGEITLVAGMNVSISQNDESKLITISATGGGGGGYANIIDEPPNSPSSLDDEFNDEVIDGKWNWANQGSALATEGDIQGKLAIIPAGDSWWRCLMQNVPTGSWEALAKVHFGGDYLDDSFAGIVILPATDGNIEALAIGKDDTNSPSTIRAERWNSWTSWGTLRKSINYGPSYAYLKIVWNGSNLTYYLSTDGVGFPKLLSSFTPSFTPGRIGVGARGNALPSYFDFFRIYN